MKFPFIIVNLKSNYCKIVFLISLILGYFLVPKDLWESSYIYLAIPFVFLFALTMACTVRNIKEKVRSKQLKGGSLISIVANILGISVLQICGIGVPMCGVSIGMSILTLFLPSTLLMSLAQYGVWMLSVIIFLQLVSLYFSGCFKTAKN